MRIVTFAVQKGGVGKTTLCVSLAALAAEGNGNAVSFVDGDPSRSARKWVARRSDALPTIDLINVFDVIESRKEQIKRQRADRHVAQASGNVVPPQPEPSLDEVEVFKEAVALAEQNGTDWLFIDTAAGVSEIAAAAVAIADLVLMPCPPSALDLEGISPTAQLVKRLRVPSYFVINKGRNSKAINDDCALYLTSTYGLPAVASHIQLRAPIADVVDSGLTLTEAGLKEASAVKGQEELRTLWRWVQKATETAVKEAVESPVPPKKPSQPIASETSN